MWVRIALISLATLIPAFGGDQVDQGVSRELARQRARTISGVRYQVNLELHPHAPRMSGHIVIRFDLAAPADPVVLDFRDGSARNLKVNDAAEELRQSNGHILISAKPGKNTIELDFDSSIAEANSAVTRFVDPQDGNEYLYTLFVPMDASLAFPCFDQPDLKARFNLTVTAPASWTVVSNGQSKRVQAIATSGKMRSVRFEETKPISTYLFAFAAGPFEKLESSQLQLFVRKSMLARAKEEWPAVAETTRKGMALMTSFFAQPFPFPKYDQVLIPGFPYGGMEHAGATFLNEDAILFRTVPTVNDYNRRNETVLHELAHQWFGDLVTMRWFDDLWLKEGFAQYMAYHALAEMEPPGIVWKRFYQSIKPLAYGIDSTHGTTPIYQRIDNLKDAKSAYGAIVYQKAPSLLRVLAFHSQRCPSPSASFCRLREALRAVEDAIHLDDFLANAIGCQPRKSRDDQFTGVWFPARAAPAWELYERIQVLVDFERNSACSIRSITFIDVIANVPEVFDGGFRPPEPH